MEVRKKNKFKSPKVTKERTFVTYNASDKEENERLRIEFVSHAKSSISSMFSNITKRIALNSAKSTQMFT